MQVTGAVAHRNPRTRYKKNEVFLDIVETTHVLLATDGAPRPFSKAGSETETCSIPPLLSLAANDEQPRAMVACNTATRYP